MKRQFRDIRHPKAGYAKGIRRLYLILASMMVTSTAFADGPCIVPGQGYFRIQVGTGGLFGSFAHNHLIEAQKISGCATIDSRDITRSSIKLTFPTMDLKVIDPKESAKDRAQVQKTMESDVLRVAEYPEVAFQSTGVDRGTSPDQLRVHGNLTIRGQARPVVIELNWKHMADGTFHAQGTYRFKQSTFGIKPIQLGGGTIKVKDELETEFEIVLK